MAPGGALLQLTREELEDKALCSCCLEDAEMLHCLQNLGRLQLLEAGGFKHRYLQQPVSFRLLPSESLVSLSPL